MNLSFIFQRGATSVSFNLWGLSGFVALATLSGCFSCQVLPVLPGGKRAVPVLWRPVMSQDVPWSVSITNYCDHWTMEWSKSSESSRSRHSKSRCIKLPREVCFQRLSRYVKVLHPVRFHLRMPSSFGANPRLNKKIKILNHKYQYKLYIFKIIYI